LNFEPTWEERFEESARKLFLEAFLNWTLNQREKNVLKPKQKRQHQKGINSRRNQKERGSRLEKREEGHKEKSQEEIGSWRN